MRIYVTGETGFIGSAFARLASASGHDVRGLSGAGRLEAPPWDEIRQFAPEIVVHTAWITEPGKYLQSESNRDFATWTIEFLRGICAMGTKHVVSLGTCIEYAPSAAPMRENETPLSASPSVYARSKTETRLALEKELHQHGVSMAWARIFYPYGPGEHPRRLCSSIATSLLEDRPVVLNTPASVKDYIYVDDIAAALLKLAESQYNGPVNVGSGEGVVVRDLASTLAALVGKPHLVSDSPTPAPDEYPCVVADTKALRALGWKPEVKLRDGLEKLVQSLS